MTLSPLSRLYGKALELRAGWYASGRIVSHALPRPSISVGNLTFGGTGKTPFVEFLARRLPFRGLAARRSSRAATAALRAESWSSRPARVRSSRPSGAATSPWRWRARPRESSWSWASGASRPPGGRPTSAPISSCSTTGSSISPWPATSTCSSRRPRSLSAAEARRPRGRLREPLRRDAPRGRHRLHARRARCARRRDARRPSPAPTRPRRSSTCASAARDCATRRAPRRARGARGRRCISVCGVAEPKQFAATLAEMSLAPEERIELRDHQRYRERHIARISGRPSARARASWSRPRRTPSSSRARRPCPLLTVRLSVEILETGFFPFLAARLASARDGVRAGNRERRDPRRETGPSMRCFAAAKRRCAALPAGARQALGGGSAGSTCASSRPVGASSSRTSLARFRKSRRKRSRRSRRASAEWVGAAFVDFLDVSRISADAVRDRIRVAGEENLARARARGQGRLPPLGPHRRLGARRDPRPGSSASRSPGGAAARQPAARTGARRRRTRFGNRLIAKRDAARDILRALRAARDRGDPRGPERAAREAVFVPFFGRLAATTPGARPLPAQDRRRRRAGLHLARGRRALPLEFETPDPRRGVPSAADRDEAVRAATARYMEVTEAAVRKARGVALDARPVANEPSRRSEQR